MLHIALRLINRILKHWVYIHLYSTKQPTFYIKLPLKQVCYWVQYTCRIFTESNRQEWESLVRYYSLSLSTLYYNLRYLPSLDIMVLYILPFAGQAMVYKRKIHPWKCFQFKTNFDLYCYWTLERYYIVCLLVLIYKTILG